MGVRFRRASWGEGEDVVERTRMYELQGEEGVRRTRERERERKERKQEIGSLDEEESSSGKCLDEKRVDEKVDRLVRAEQLLRREKQKERERVGCRKDSQALNALDAC